MKSGSTLANILIALTIIGLSLTVALLFTQNRKLLNFALKNSTSPTPTPVFETPTMYLENETPSPTPSSSVISDATVVYESELDIPANHKSQIQTRVVEPFLMYYADQSGQDYVKSLTISINNEANKVSFPYLAKYVFGDGVNGGFVITTKEALINWWYPECMGPCPFTEDFKTKYPEVVKSSSN